ncbi:Uma2 family endonuclease [Roseofilum capinflatum]|uniref:Uma2 family endonuclease n=1 Tax=Roseofilum capinflatum BLCC-M114 TaxID=3022440 RepID=A0ABT7B9E0_9CYAN|nr:Uma2 family endonuclease [Roseofilum capinflatum]MDJ1175432.1 Uma2 family endonuclease [Roseofilum capinflatum BLCC-M114]
MATLSRSSVPVWLSSGRGLRSDRFYPLETRYTEQGYNYPDVMVISLPVELQEGRKETVTNPLMIAEVLSKSTKNYDKDEKFAAYRSISSFQEYLLIDQYQTKVEHYYKAKVNQWVFSEYQSRADLVKLTSLPCEISLADLYDDLQW